MSWTRLLLSVLLAALAAGQQTPVPKAAKPRAQEPALPVVDYDACPFEGCIFRQWTVTKTSTLYDTWRNNRKVIGRMTSGEEVEGLTGVHITRRPEKFLVKKAIPFFSLKAGDTVLQYQEFGEGYADLWANGVWHKDFDWSQTQDGEPTLTDGGFTLPLVFTDENITLIRRGVKEWWVQIRRADGKTGWAMSDGNNFAHMDRFGDP